MRPDELLVLFDVDSLVPDAELVELPVPLDVADCVFVSLNVVSSLVASVLVEVVLWVNTLVPSTVLVPVCFV